MSGEKPEAKLDRILLFLGANIVVGVGVPAFIVALTPVNLDVYQQALLGLLIVTVLSLGELVTRVEVMYQIRIKEWEAWSERTKIDAIIGEIRHGLHEMIADESLRDSFFLDHYTRELELVRSRIQTTMTNSEIMLDRHHIDSTRVLLSIYDEANHNTFRATHVCGDMVDFLDITFQVWYRAWLERLNSGQVKSLRRLFIYDNEKELSWQSNTKLMAFHNSGVSGLEGKVIGKNEVARFKSDYHITDGVLDFGIFSNSYLYLGQTRKGDDISGHYSRNSALIKTYTNIFDGLWNSTLAEPVTRYVAASISIDDLFNKNFKIPENPTISNRVPLGDVGRTA